MGFTRIIAGEAKGRKLRVPESGTRPTSDRAREGLFSSLEARFGIAGSRFLDLFSGSGAMGLEAASRGASEVVLVESSSAASAVIRRNIDTVGHTQCTVVESTVETYLTSAPRNFFDIVVADPPYVYEAIPELVAAVAPCLKDGGVVVIERHVDSPETPWPAQFTPTAQKLKKRTYGIARMDMAVFHREDSAS